MKPEIVTIGVYGYDSEHFFRALVNAHVDTFCDVRARRGVRGSAYAFANSTRLQQRLHELGIRYLHRKDLAPSLNTRVMQAQEDKQHKVAKRKRTTLGQTFEHSYEQECLANFDAQQFLADLGEQAKVVCLFCVERDPHACHRSLLAQKLADDTGVQVEHIVL